MSKPIKSVLKRKSPEDQEEKEGNKQSEKDGPVPIVEKIQCIRNHRVSFLTDATLQTYQDAIKRQLEKQLSMLESREYNESELDLIYQQMGSLLLSSTARIQDSGRNAPIQHGIALMERYRHVDLLYQNAGLKLTGSALDASWRQVEKPVTWNTRVLNKLNKQRRQAIMAFTTSLTHVGEMFIKKMDEYQATHGDTCFAKLFKPGDMQGDENLRHLCCEVLGTESAIGCFERIEDLAKTTWRVDLTLFFALDQQPLKPLLSHLALPERFLHLRKEIVFLMDIIEDLGVRLKACAVLYEYLWPKLFNSHLCSRLQLFFYVFRLCAPPTQGEINFFHALCKEGMESNNKEQ